MIVTKATLADPVRLGPFQLIRKVHWGGGATHFNGSTYLTRADVISGVSDSPLVTGFFSIRVASYSDINVNSLVFAFANGFQPVFEVSLIGRDGGGGAVVDGSISLTCADGPAGTNIVEFLTPPGLIVPGHWALVSFSIDTNHAAGDRICWVSVGGGAPVAAVPRNGALDIGAAFAINFTDASALHAVNLGVSFAGQPPNVFDMADFWLDPGLLLDLNSSARFDFVTAAGKRVGLGANGEIPTGTRPALFFHGNKDTFGDNVGSGGDFATVGALLNATTSPP